MKRIILSLLLAVISVTAFSQSGDITVEVESVAVTGHTTIEYNFTGIETRTYDLTVEVSFDNGVGYQPIPETHLSGDWPSVSSPVPVFSGTIMWNGAASFPNRYSDQTRIKITATPVFQCGDNVTFTYRGSSVTYGTVLVDYVGSNGGSIGERCWMDRNLGASQVATSSTDADAYGDLFQWGRLDDGHQVRDPLSGTTTDLSTTDVPVQGIYILATDDPFDWLSPQNDNLWQGGADDNNPCPPGWRVPTEAELEAERLSWNSDDSAGAIDSPLKLPLAGYRHVSDGSLGNVDSSGSCWSSTIDGVNSKRLRFSSTNAYMFSSKRASGFSVRCIKD